MQTSSDDNKIKVKREILSEIKQNKPGKLRNSFC